MVSLVKKKQLLARHVMLYGGAKSGKTLLAGKLAEYFKVIYIGCENGHEVLYKLPVAWQENIEIVDLPDTRGYPIAIETVLKLVKGKQAVCTLHGKCGCMLCKRSMKDDAELILEEMFTNVDLPSLDNNTVVIFDSATQLTNSCIAHITKNEADDYKMQTDDWGSLGKLMDIVFSYIQQAPYHVVMISHENMTETEGKKTSLTPVAGSRNFSRTVAKYFGDVVYAERKNKKHTFMSSTTDASNIMAGSRSDVDLTAMGEDASLLAIFKPELYGGTLPVVTVEPTNLKLNEPKAKPVLAGNKTASTVGSNTKSILANLKKR